MPNASPNETRERALPVSGDGAALGVSPRVGQSIYTGSTHLSCCEPHNARILFKNNLSSGQASAATLRSLFIRIRFASRVLTYAFLRLPVRNTQPAIQRYPTEMSCQLHWPQ